MTIVIKDAFMKKRMERALHVGGDLYDFTDLAAELQKGSMQGHVELDTWAITQVQDFPRKRVVDIFTVVGNMEGSLLLEKSITKWAKEINADMLTSVGRDGWWNFRTPGWKRVGTLYSKELKND